MNDEACVEVTCQEAGSAAALNDAPAPAFGLLEENEIIEFSLRPSLWFVAFVSARFVAVAAIATAALAIVARDASSTIAVYAIPLVVLAAIARGAVGMLQWASRVYVLTNRRVMRFSGVLTVDIAQCQLVHVGRSNLEFDTMQRLLRLGSIRLTPAGEQDDIMWEHVAHAGEIHEKVIRAIKRAKLKK